MPGFRTDGELNTTMAAVETQAKRICSMEGCNQEIYLRPEEREVCAGCELRGGPPPARPVEDRAEGGSDAQRVKAYLAGMTVEERQYQIKNLEQFNGALAEQWRQWNDELTAEEATQH